MSGFIAPVIALDLKPGGLWEASYNLESKIGDPGNILNEVLAFVPEKMLSIRIHRTPPGFPHPEVGKAVWTVLWFEDIGGNKTRVTVEMLPWKAGPEWDLLYQLFSQGNEVALRRAQAYFISGPIDWVAEMTKE